MPHRLPPTEILAALDEWAARPGRPEDRLVEVRRLAKDHPRAWSEAILSRLPDEPTNMVGSPLVSALGAVLDVAPDPEAMRAELAAHSRERRTAVSVVAQAIMRQGTAAGALHVLEVLGEELVFDGLTRLHRNSDFEDFCDRPPEHAADWWAWEVMDYLTEEDPDSAWMLVLHYIDYEPDATPRDDNGMEWLETLYYTHSAAFIDRIEQEAARNPRLRAVMRGLYPPKSDPEVERRFLTAAAEPGDPPAPGWRPAQSA